MKKSLRPNDSVCGIPETNPFQTSRFRLSFAMGLQFVRHCATLLRLCFFYNLQAKLGGTKSKFRYFWRIYLN
jgi:hypothetical protein